LFSTATADGLKPPRGQCVRNPEHRPSPWCVSRYIYPFFLAAHRAFIIADNFLRAAGLIGLRPAVFFWAAEPFFGADAPFCFAHRAR
jgi:hypothetical protein